MLVVFVKKVKRPASSGIWSSYVLGTDGFGTWLHTPAGSIYRGEDGRQTGVCEVAQDHLGVGQPIVQLITPGAWWIATWYPPSADRDVTIDICTPAVLVGNTWTYTDMELGGLLMHSVGSMGAKSRHRRPATQTIERLLRQRTSLTG